MKLLALILALLFPFAGSAANVSGPPSHGDLMFKLCAATDEDPMMCLIKHADDEAEAIESATLALQMCGNWERLNVMDVRSAANCKAIRTYVKERWNQ